MLIYIYYILHFFTLFHFATINCITLACNNLVCFALRYPITHYLSTNLRGAQQGG